jgi:hypothetical protein
MHLPTSALPPVAYILNFLSDKPTRTDGTEPLVPTKDTRITSTFILMDQQFHPKKHACDISTNTALLCSTHVPIMDKRFGNTLYSYVYAPSLLLSCALRTPYIEQDHFCNNNNNIFWTRVSIYLRILI